MFAFHSDGSAIVHASQSIDSQTSVNLDVWKDILIKVSASELL